MLYAYYFSLLILLFKKKEEEGRGPMKGKTPKWKWKELMETDIW